MPFVLQSRALRPVQHYKQHPVPHARVRGVGVVRRAVLPDLRVRGRVRRHHVRARQRGGRRCAAHYTVY